MDFNEKLANVVNRYNEVEYGIKETIQNKRNMLNGFPAVNHMQ